MNSQTLKALKQSIAHWRRLATGKSRMLETVGGNDCALCRVFFNRHYRTCTGCPVQKKTGLDLCHCTPYHNATLALFKGKQSPQFKRAARLELNFLESLLPKKRKATR